MIPLPPRLAERLANEGDAGREWADTLPALLDELARRWQLRLGEPYRPGGVTSLALAATREGGERVVVKLPFPDPEVEGEAEALAAVAGDGAVRLLAHDAASGALLLEAGDDTRTLGDVADAEMAVDLAAGLLERWWRPAPAGVHPHVRAAARLRHDLEGRRHLVARVVPAAVVGRAFATLDGVDPSADTLLHTDLHQDNVLAAQREPWLVIDPKPLAGEPAYDLEPLLRDGRPGPLDDEPAVLRRFDRLTERLGLDRQRTADWVLTRSLVEGSWSVAAGDPGFGWPQIRRGVAVATSR